MIIKTRNTLTINAPKTFLTNLEAAGTNVFRLKNPNGFTASWGIQIGETGEEQSEVLVISGVPGTLGTTTANSQYEHPADTPVYAIKYDQVVFERSTSGTAGTATPMTNGTVTVQADHDHTIFDDTSGSSTYAYRTYFRSSGLAANSTESDWITSGGFSFYSLAKIRDRIKNKLWDSSFIKEDLTIDEWTNECKDKLSNILIQANEDNALGTVEVAFGTSGLGTISTADFSQVRRVWITYSGTNQYRSTKMNVNDFYPGQQFSSSDPYHYFQGDTIIGVKPEGNGGTAHLVFYRWGTTLVNDTDELPQPMRGHTDKFVDYGLIQAQYKDQKISHTDKKGLEQALFNDFRNDITPRDKSGATYVDINEPISGEDIYY